MNRRSFIAGLLAAAALDPERLLYVPGKKRIILPARRRWAGRVIGQEEGLSGVRLEFVETTSPFMNGWLDCPRIAMLGDTLRARHEDLALSTGPISQWKPYGVTIDGRSLVSMDLFHE